MIVSLFDYFSHDHFMPHGHCYLWKPGILWLHVVSDVVIAISYFSIPLMLFYFVSKKKNLPYPKIFKLFALFIFWCGLTHLIAIWTVWDPVYQIEGLAKGVTAGVSLVTALSLFPILPHLLALRSPKELDELNAKLKVALDEKNQAESNLLVANQNLEAIVEQRTKEIIQHTKKLQTMNQELELFAYQASHDLKSPLSTVISYFSEIEDSKENKLEKLDQYLPIIQKQLNQLNRLITDLLELSRMGASPLKKEWVNLKEIIDDVRSSLYFKIEETGAKIYSDLNFEIYANPLHLTLIFQNLIENSIKYVETGTTPEIIVSADSETEDSWRFQIKDNGIGIPQDSYEKVFQPFQRLHSLDEFPGTGLGLSICKKVVEEHGGEIFMESEPGKGTSIFFSISKDKEGLNQ